MNIEQLDSNFLAEQVKEPDVVWKNALEEPFSLHGIYYSQKDGNYRRMPLEIAEQISNGVKELSSHPAGGRLRFKTDSPYITIGAEIYRTFPTSNFGITGQSAFAIYIENTFMGCKGPGYAQLYKATEDVYSFNSIFYRRRDDIGMKSFDIYFPTYNAVKALWIGIKEGSSIQAADKLPNEQPVVFYGSSITQGGCASHAGNNYPALLSRWLNVDYVNLGFSGNAKGEPKMAEYIASLDMQAFIYDYDHNANTLELLQATHAPMYEIIRKKHPNLPIIIMSRPNFDYEREKNAQRRAIIYDTYAKAKARGDKVEFIDGETLFGEADRDACTVDTCHPNDLGFYRIAQAIRPVLEKFL